MSTTDRLEDLERAEHIAHAAGQVQKFMDTIVRAYCHEHPHDPIVHGYHAAVSNLAALTDAGIIRGHLRLVEQIGAGE